MRFSQRTVLTSVINAGVPVGPQWIAADAHIDVVNVLRILRELEAMGYVGRRDADPSSLGQVFSATDPGKLALARGL
jgi:DNA-binding MarR family transcriptional regulator